MGRISSSILVAAVAALVAAAALDGLRGDGEEAAPSAPATGPETVRTPPGEDPERAAAEELRAAGVRGTLVWTDERCRLHGLSLPDLAAVRPREGRTCRYRGRDEGWTPYAVDVPAPHADVVARCRAGSIELYRGAAIVPNERFPGCAPAWKPDGTLTFVGGGELAAHVRCAGGARTLLSRRDLVAALGRDPWAFRRPVPKQAGWLGDDTVAALVRDRAQGVDAIAIFRGRELVEAPPFAYERLSDLRVSPYGSFVAARVNRSGLVLLDDRGRFQTTGLRSAHAATWSPDETWTAMATETGIFVFETGKGAAVGLIQVPVRAADLVWR